MISELDIKQKEKLGQGVDHTAFPFIKQPKKIIKTKYGNLELVKNGQYLVTRKKYGTENEPGTGINSKQLELFKKYPQFCVRVYKETPNYVVLERLDVENFEADCELGLHCLEGIFKEDQQLIKDVLNNYIGNSLSYAAARLVSNYYDRDATKEDVLRLLKQCPGLFVELVRFFNDLRKTELGRAFYDIHDGNLAYDSTGNIKIIDI
jgi:hypothetical protein